MWELIEGDWQCGQSLKDELEPIFVQAAAIDPFTANTRAMHQQIVNATRRRANQPSAGCTYAIEQWPQLPKFIDASTKQTAPLQPPNPLLPNPVVK
jgi:hypothetical protein